MNAELYREAGFDLDLFKDESGIEVDLQFEPQRDRSGWSAEGRLAWLQRALSGYIIRKCRDLLKSEG
jgi:hypothetical protein